MDLLYIALFIKNRTFIFKEEHDKLKNLYSVSYADNWFYVYQNDNGYWETDILGFENGEINQEFSSMNNAIFFSIIKCLI